MIECFTIFLCSLQQNSALRVVCCLRGTGAPMYLSIIAFEMDIIRMWMHTFEKQQINFRMHIFKQGWIDALN